MMNKVERRLAGYLNISEVVRLLKVHRNTFDYHRKLNYIPPPNYLIGGRLYYKNIEVAKLKDYFFKLKKIRVGDRRLMVTSEHGAKLIRIKELERA